MYRKRGWGLGLEENSIIENNLTYIVTSLIGIMILYKYIKSNNTYIKLKNKIVLSFAVAGVCSNLIDRVWKGYVINYIKFPNFTSINLAYIYLLITWIGIAVMLTSHTMKVLEERKRNKK